MTSSILHEEPTQPEPHETSVKESLLPQRKRMVINAIALALVIVALLFVAAIIRQQHTSQSKSMAQSAGNSSAADNILQSGGKVCTNGAAGTNQAAGSTNPSSVGMMLQNVPDNTIQTPQGLGTANSDLTTLQSASCY